MTEPLQSNVLYYRDNLDMQRRYLPDAGIDLIVLNRPFNSNRPCKVVVRDELAHATGTPPGARSLGSNRNE